MNSIDEKIVKIKRELDNLNTQKVATATRLKSLEEEKGELLRECKLLNVDPQKIGEIIKVQEEIVQKEIEHVQKLLEGFNAFRN